MNELSRWKIVPEETHSHVARFLNPATGSTAAVKWDGCTHYYRRDPAMDEPDEEPCYHHICDLDEEIARLQELKRLALLYFGGEFACGGWQEDYTQQLYVALVEAAQDL